MDESKEENGFYFYKLSSVVVNELGPEAGVVHAVIWNGSQNGRACGLSEETIGNLLGMSYQRVGNTIELLLKSGFVEEAEGNKKYRTKFYKIVEQKIEKGISKDTMRTMKSNDIRISRHKINRDAFITGNKAGYDSSQKVI